MFLNNKEFNVFKYEQISNMTSLISFESLLTSWEDDNYAKNCGVNYSFEYEKYVSIWLFTFLIIGFLGLWNYYLDK